MRARVPPLHKPRGFKFRLGLLCVPVWCHYMNRILLSFALVLCSCPECHPLPCCRLYSLAVIVETSWFQIILVVVRAPCVTHYRTLPPFSLVGVRTFKRLLLSAIDRHLTITCVPPLYSWSRHFVVVHVICDHDISTTVSAISYFIIFTLYYL